MNVTELERIAAKGGEMPDDLRMHEQLLFLTLRTLYHSFRSGAVNKERGSREKQRIMQAYTALQMDQRVMDQHRAIRRRMENQIGNLYRCGCEHCLQLLKYLDGIDRRDIPEDVAELQTWNDKLRALVKQKSDRAADLSTIIGSVRRVLDDDIPDTDKLTKIKEIIS